MKKQPHRRKMKCKHKKQKNNHWDDTRSDMVVVEGLKIHEYHMKHLRRNNKKKKGKETENRYVKISSYHEIGWTKKKNIFDWCADTL